MRLPYNFKDRIVGGTAERADGRDSDGPAVRSYQKISRRIFAAILLRSSEAADSDSAKSRSRRIVAGAA